VLPGKKYTPEDLLLIAWRRKWWILIPFVVVAVGRWSCRATSRTVTVETLIQMSAEGAEDYVRHCHGRHDERPADQPADPGAARAPEESPTRSVSGERRRMIWRMSR
jgi:hypothetical protein